MTRVTRRGPSAVTRPRASGARASRVGASLRLAALALLVGVNAGGCSLWRMARFTEPVVELRDVQLVGLDLTGGALDVVLSVYNPNGFRLDATRLTYRVAVDSVEVGRGELSERFVVAGNDTAEVRLPVRFRYAGLGAAASQLLRTGRVTYRVSGDLGVQTPVGAFTRGYDRVGRFAARGRD